MIATDNQLRISEDRLARFSSTLSKLSANQNNRDPIVFARISALQDQVEALETEIREYRSLRSGAVRELFVDTLVDLPNALIKARIARSLSQSALAELLGVKPQQVQRWETEGYRKASFERLRQIAEVLNLRVSEKIVLDERSPVTLSQIRKSLSAIGLPRNVIDQRLVPARLSDDSRAIVNETAARIDVVLGLELNDLIARPKLVEPSALFFKLPKSAEQSKTRAYAYYVTGLCRIVSKTARHKPRRLPKSWEEAHKLFFKSGIDFGSAVAACWRLGVPVFALNDSVAFHGACWREEGRAVIALKQNSPDVSRWLADLLHEYYHAANSSPDDNFAIIEADETSSDRRDSIDERRAHRFAAEAITNGRTESLTTRIFELASGQGPRLKRATVQVAEESGVPVGILANLMAHRLAENKFDWWGVATSLQTRSDSPWKLVRKIFFEYADFSRLSRLENDLLMQALET